MKSFGIAALCLAWCSGLAWSAPLIARFETVLGDFEVVLDSASAPRSVENFIRYANRGAFDSTIIHRSTTYNPANIQIVQGGGFGLVGNTIAPVSTDPPIPLEATLPNRRGTIALARTAAADSATSQWFFNVTDNPGLDFNYAVFGRVLGGGQSVVDAMGAAPVYDVTAQLGFPELPLLQPSLNAASLLLVTCVRVETFAITNITRSGSTAELRWMPLSTNTPAKVQRTATALLPGLDQRLGPGHGRIHDLIAPFARCADIIRAQRKSNPLGWSGPALGAQVAPPRAVVVPDVMIGAVFAIGQ